MASRGHNVTVFVPSRFVTGANKVFVGASVSVRASHHRHEDDEGMPDGMLGLLWKTPRILDHVVMNPAVMMVLQGFVRDSPIADAVELIRGCDLVIVDAFQYLFADAAAELELPAAVFHSFISILVPPERSWLINRASTLDVSSTNSLRNPFEYLVLNVVAPVVQTLSHTICGLLIHGYPRFMWSSVYARPLLLNGPASMMLTATPRSVIPLGGAYVDFDMRINPYPYRVFLPGCKRVDSERLLYAAFGTNVKIPRHYVEKLCHVFKGVLDNPASGIDHVVFAFRGLDFTPGACHEVCNDERILTGSWANQTEILSSGRVAAFITHGGFSSIWEGVSSHTPMCVMPIFGDQFEYGDWVASAQYGSYCDKSWSVERLIGTLLAIIREKDSIVQRMVHGRAMDSLSLGPASVSERAAGLMELMLKEGVNNSLQRLVDPIWAPYAQKGGNRMIGTAATYAVLVWWILIALWIHLTLRCCGSMFRMCCGKRASNNNNR